MKILIINPNSSRKVTDDLKSIIKSDTTHYDFYTAPQEAPKEIDGEETSKLSEQIVLSDLVNNRWLDYDGYLVCCFSDHPLIHSLALHTSAPIMGIMQACLIYKLSDVSIHKSIIVTSFKSWEPILDQSVLRFYNLSQFPPDMSHSVSFNINVTNLNNPDQYNAIKQKVSQVVQEGVDCIFLGCAGMVGLDEKLTRDFQGVKFIDSIKIGVELLMALIRFTNSNESSNKGVSIDQARFNEVGQSSTS